MTDEIIIIGARLTYGDEGAGLQPYPEIELLLTCDEFNLLNQIINGFENAQEYRAELEMMSVRRNFD